MGDSEGLSCIKILETHSVVLDQTLVPNEVKYIDILNNEDAWVAIREMKVRGAPLIAVVALQGLRASLIKETSIHGDAKLIHEFLVKSSDYLKGSRPTAVNLANDLDDLLKSVEGITEPAQLLEKVYSQVQKNYDDYANSSYEIGRHGADIILNDPKFSTKESLSILTICNTGKLAMPGIGTALGIIREISSRGKLKSLYIPETRPYNQGSRLTAFEAVMDKLPGTLISDSMVGMLMRNKMVDLVIVGADRVTKLGFTANKIGTYTFAVSANAHNIPFYVACPVSTIDMNMDYGRDIVIEERPADELRKVKDIYLSPKDIPVWNPSFDVTPPHLIEKIITEKGSYEFDRNSGAWESLTTKKIEAYFKKNKLFEEDEEVTITDVADGNLNNVYCLRGKNKIYCAKQALPYVKCVGEWWPLSLKRSLFEGEALKFEQSVCPELVPQFIHFNDDLALLVEEFLDNHIILRKEMIGGVRVNDIGKKIGEFVAKTCFYSSGLHLKPQVLREKMSFWNGNTICELTEQVIFSDPYFKAQLNRHTSPYLDEIVEDIRTDKEVLVSVYKLRQKFVNEKQALVHGDLHTGSIMVDKKDSLKVIDAEFAFYGPIGFDTGMFIANLIMNYFSQKATTHGDTDYAEYVLKEIVSFWSVFSQEWSRLWANKEIRTDDFGGLYEKNPEILEAIKNQYIEDLFVDTVGFAGVEIIRRIVGVAHNADFETIENLELKGEREKLALSFARTLLKAPSKIGTIEDFVQIARDLNGSN